MIADADDAPLELRAEGVSSKIRDEFLLREIQWSGSTGEVWGILGPNGAGKSTFLTRLAGFTASYAAADRNERGNIMLNGRELRTLSARERATTFAYLPQEPELPESLDVFETVMLGRTPYRSVFAAPSANDRRLVDEALERMALSKMRHRTPRQLSGGEVQRMHLARILAQDARIWLLDEPYGHLDFAHQQAFVQTLTELAREKQLLMVVVAHDLVFLPRFADKLLLMKQGTLVAAGARAAVWNTANAETTFGVRFDEPDAGSLWPSAGRAGA